MYIGVTNDLRLRLAQHRLGRGSEFVHKYGVHRLVYVESYETAMESYPAPETIAEMESRLEDSGWLRRTIFEWRDLSDLII